MKRYAFVACALTYAAGLIALHVLGLFPRPDLYDISHLIGSPSIGFEGKVVNFPITRWNQTRFLLEGRARPQEAFQGRVVVTLCFPVPDLAPGEIIRVRGWLSAPRDPTPRHPFDERSFWAGYRTYALMRVWSPDSLDRRSLGGRRSFAQWAWLFHQRFKAFCFDRFTDDEAALLCGITMGTKGVLKPSIKNQCIRAGVYHILVVSGQKVALLVTLGIGLLRVCHVPRRWAFWISTPLIVFYAYAVGADPPVVRASTMAIVVLATLAMGRDIPRYYPLVLAGLWIVLREPEALFGASFQLSFGATASLVYAFPRIRESLVRRSRLKRWFLEAGAICLAVHLGVWPFLVYYFHQISLVGLIANWTLFPFSGFVMVCGLVVGTWGAFFPNTVPEICICVMHGLLQATLYAIDRMSHGSWSAIPLPAPSIKLCLVYYALLFGILFWRRLNHAKATSSS